MGKSGRKFWEKQNGGNIKRRMPDHRRGVEDQHFFIGILQLKARLKRWTSLLLLASMFFVVWFAGQISMPQSDNVTVGIVEQTERMEKKCWNI